MGRGFAHLTVIAAVLTQAACAHTATKQLSKYDLREGYRFERLPLSKGPPKNSDDLFVVLAFSGGGTRAAAMSYGVLAQLRAVKFHWDPVQRKPVSCDSRTEARCNAIERSLLDEVDVISSVSGGSFTAAYYALHGRTIFDDTSRFHRAFLYHRVQSDLMGAILKPKNWDHLMSRVEIAAEYYARNIYGDATFADLAKGERPYLILNSTDASTGARFEFTQEQFDLLCADLSAFPIARGVAASSAFPALLNSMTIDAHDRQGCGYKVPGWVELATDDAFLNYRRYSAARQLLAYRDSSRRYLHVLDGGLADNLGLRSVLQSLNSTDRPIGTIVNGDTALGGWSILSKINRREVKTIVVITVDARTNRKNNWDTKARGPGLYSVVDASAGIPMGNFTTETLELLREYGFDAGLNQGRARQDSACACVRADDFSPRFYGVEIAIDNDTNPEEQSFLREAGTNFQLSSLTVDCLIDRSARLLRESQSVTESNPQAFPEFVATQLKGVVSEPDTPHPASCTKDASKQSHQRSKHILDIGLGYHSTRPRGGDVSEGSSGVGLLFHIASQHGLSPTFGLVSESFTVPGTVGSDTLSIGSLRLSGPTLGVKLSQRVGVAEFSARLDGGYGFGRFRLNDNAREQYALRGTLGVRTDAKGAWMARPSANAWVELSEHVGATITTSYLFARPTIRLRANAPLDDRTVRLRALMLSAGLAYRVF